jgi:putative transposase
MKLANVPEEYKYSSASFYMTGVDAFGMLQHYMG